MNNSLVGKMFQNVPWGSYNITQPLWEPVIGRMNLKIITFTLILTLFLAPTVRLINAQEDTDPIIEESSIDPSILVFVKLQAQNREQEMWQLFGDDMPPDAANSWTHAQEFMEQARNYEDENPNEATQLYLRAMRQFRNALRKYVEEYPEAIGTVSEETGTASEDIPETTEEEITLARSQLINQFQERFQEQLTAMIQNVEEMQGDMSPQDAYKAQQSLIKAANKLFKIQRRIQAREYMGALDDLDEATQTLDLEIDELEDPGTAQMLRTMNKLEAKIQKMMQISANKAARGEDISKEDALLGELRGNKDKIKNEYKGKGNQGKGGK
ncbi:hypothetical protein ACFL0D_09420 [Thermoproteota archaeon]